jgi:hypothetical protein
MRHDQKLENDKEVMMAILQGKGGAKVQHCISRAFILCSFSTIADMNAIVQAIVDHSTLEVSWIKITHATAEWVRLILSQRQIR